MTTGEMGEQAKWVYGRFTGKAASTISSAWRSLGTAITCFHRAQGNPQVFRFYLCLIPYDAARQNIETLYDMLYVGHNAKRRAPWRDMWEWNAGDLEYRDLFHEFNLVAGLRNRVQAHLQEGLQQEIVRVSSIQDPEQQIQANLDLLDNPLADIVPSGQKQEVRNQLQVNLANVRSQKARNEAARRFNGRQSALLEQIRRNALDEEAWDQYLQLLKSEDAALSLDPGTRLQAIEDLGRQKQQAIAINRANQLREAFEKEATRLRKHYQENPTQTLQDYLVLLDSEAGRSLPDHDSLVSQTLKDLNTWKEQQRKVDETQPVTSAPATSGYCDVNEGCPDLVEIHSPLNDLANAIGEIYLILASPGGVLKAGSKGVKLLEALLLKAKPTKGHPNQLMYELEDGTKVLFRRILVKKLIH